MMEMKADERASERKCKRVNLMRPDEGGNKWPGQAAFPTAPLLLGRPWSLQSNGAAAAYQRIAPARARPAFYCPAATISLPIGQTGPSKVATTRE